MRPNDILLPDDDLRSLAADLEAIYDVPAPAGLAARIDAAVANQSLPGEAQNTTILGNRTARTTRHDGGIAQPHVPGHGRGWWSGLAATAAMFAVVALLAAVLHGGIGGSPGDSLPKHFAQVGGLRVVAKALPCSDSTATCDLTRVFAQESSVLEHRFAAGLNAHDISIHQDTSGQLTIDLAGVTDQAAARALLAQGQFVALDTGETALTVGFDVRTIYVLYAQAFTGEQIDASAVQVGLDQASGQPGVTFALRSQAREQFAEFTHAHIGHYLTFTLDGIVLESAVIQAPITGSIQVIGLPSMAAAQRLALFLRSGALPLPLQVMSITVVHPSGAPASCATPTGTGVPSAFATATSTPTPTPLPIPTATAAPNSGSGGTSTTISRVGDASASSGPAICPTPTPYVSGAPTATAIPPRSTDTAPPTTVPTPTPTPSPPAMP